MESVWRGDRVVYGNGLENRRGATHREFESPPLRQKCPTRTQGVVAPYGHEYVTEVRSSALGLRNGIVTSARGVFLCVGSAALI
jgi:hypothetical protein